MCILTLLVFPGNLPSGKVFVSGYRGFAGGSVVMNLPAVQEMWFQSLAWEDPLEKEMETHSNILAWEIPGTEEPGAVQSVVSQSETQLSS